MAPDELHAALAAGTAAAVTAALTPVVGRISRRFGLLDEPRERGLSERMTPLLGGVAIFAGVVVAALVFTLVGALDDIYDLHPALKLAGQAGAAALPVAAGVTVDNFTLPFVH